MVCIRTIAMIHNVELCIYTLLKSLYRMAQKECNDFDR